MIRIGLVFTYNLHYCRGILQGIKRYAEGRSEWTLLLLGPEPKALRDLRAFRPAGVIAYIFREGLHKALIGLHKPLVNVCGVLPNLNIPRVGVDNVMVGQLAAEHLLERGLRHFGYVGHSRHRGTTRSRSAGAATKGVQRRIASACSHRISRAHS